MPTISVIHQWSVCWPSTGNFRRLAPAIYVHSDPVLDMYLATFFEQFGRAQTTYFPISVVSHDGPRPNLLPQEYVAS